MSTITKPLKKDKKENLKKEDRILREQLCKYKKLLDEQKNSLDTQKSHIQSLQQDIVRMRPFVEFTKTLKQDNPTLWQHYATKTINNNK